VGASSADIRLEQDITLKGEKVTKALRDHYFSEVEVTD
jgi:beta-glucosidase